MRDVLSTEELVVPDDVTVQIKSRLVTVTGPRGTLTKNLRHVNMDIQVVPAKKNGKSVVSLAVWQGGRKHVACLRTIRSSINNMITGVTKVRHLLPPLGSEQTHGGQTSALFFSLPDSVR
jgi:large subunit ribosomal protein L9e